MQSYKKRNIFSKYRRLSRVKKFRLLSVRDFRYVFEEIRYLYPATSDNSVLN